MKLFTSILEWTLVIFLLLGGANTIAGALVDSDPLHPVLIIVFGVLFVVGAILDVAGRFKKAYRVRQLGLIIIFFSLMFGFLLELLAFPGDWMVWIDSGVLFLIAGFVRIRVYKEASDGKVQ